METGIQWPRLRFFPVPAKILVTAVLITVAIGLLGALGQIIVHDIIPTFFTKAPSINSASNGRSHSEGHAGHHAPDSEREDLLSEIVNGEKKVDAPMYASEQFVWTLRWSHIHLFGMNIIFIIVGVVTSFLNLTSYARSWLIALPFIGVQVDIASMWLKGYVSEHFFWLHIPGGGLFTAIFIYVFYKAIGEMWFSERPR